MDVDPYSERADYDIYDDFELKTTPFRLLDLYIIIHRFKPYSAGIDFSRQNLTSMGVSF